MMLRSVTVVEGWVERVENVEMSVTWVPLGALTYHTYSNLWGNRD